MDLPLPRPVVQDGRPCVMCKLKPGEYVINWHPAGTHPLAARMACPCCGYPDIFPFVWPGHAQELGQHVVQMDGRLIVTLQPGWTCTWPTCRRSIQLYGSRFIVAEPA